MPQKHADAERIGGPGASHENRREPHKSKPHGELNREDAGSSNVQKRTQRKTSEGGSDSFASRADAGAGSGPRPAEKGGINPFGHTARDDDAVKPKNRRQVR